ncbi:hypothetical protein CSUI_010288 [Cystoisospora suis]|uniref:Uncharacterized protein n=1 Tax=Cystoisospora suis TaxID=483139 RepID=A0A2C6KH99_9APIC|nr:hypothetical protein CSUI_010288 [Cystoisospora suis]
MHQLGAGRRRQPTRMRASYRQVHSGGLRQRRNCSNFFLPCTSLRNTLNNYHHVVKMLFDPQCGEHGSFQRAAHVEYRPRSRAYDRLHEGLEVASVLRGPWGLFRSRTRLVVGPRHDRVVRMRAPSRSRRQTYFPRLPRADLGRTVAVRSNELPGSSPAKSRIPFSEPNTTQHRH